jgi:hypothetical protein
MEMALAALDAKARFRAKVPRDAMISLGEGVRAIRSSAARRALQIGLIGRSATEVTGYETHKVMERKLASIAAAYGGTSREGGFFPQTELRNFQMLADFGSVLIARASIVEVRALPPRCTTRTNGSELNFPYSHQDDLFRPPMSDEPPMFALLLTCRDKEVRGKYHEVAIAVIEPDYSGFIFYEDVDTFIAGYTKGSESADDPTSETDTAAPDGFQIKLRDVKKPFEGGEHPQLPEEESGQDD